MSETVRKSGEVVIGPLTLVIEELSVEGEIGLLNHLRRRVKDAMGPASYYGNVLPTVDWLRANGRAGEAAGLLKETAGLVATAAPVGDDAVWAYLDTPDGLADELFGRTRRTMPDARRDEVRAVINDANAPEVRAQITDALSAKKAPTPSA